MLDSSIADFHNFCSISSSQFPAELYKVEQRTYLDLGIVVIFLHLGVWIILVHAHVDLRNANLLTRKVPPDGGLDLNDQSELLHSDPPA